MGVSLIYISSETIVNYVSKNPVNWLEDFKGMAKRGGIGDQAGVTPTPAIQEFLELYHDTKSLFTQRDYRDWCFKRWRNWLEEKPKAQQDGVAVKLYRNFYPSMIDSLHVWAMLAETKKFDVCVLDSTEDAIGKTDLTLRQNEIMHRIALQIGTKSGIDNRKYKCKHRNGGQEIERIEIWLPMSRSRTPGNKRWYELDDFSKLLGQMESE